MKKKAIFLGTAPAVGLFQARSLMFDKEGSFHISKTWPGIRKVIKGRKVAHRTPLERENLFTWDSVNSFTPDHLIIIYSYCQVYKLIGSKIQRDHYE